MTGKLQCIKQACKITDQIFAEVIKHFKEFKTEEDCASFIRKQMRKYSVRQAFPIIVASGKNAFNLHHRPIKQKLKPGFCVIDFGVKVNDYCSDMSRTVYLGKPRKDEVERYKKVVSVNAKSIAKIKTGKPWRDVDAYARKLFGRWHKKFIHGLGHGVSKKVHDKPKISPKSEAVVKIGDVVTIEPGLYVKSKYGIRVEDVVVVKRERVEVLTNSTKKLIQIRNFPFS